MNFSFGAHYGIGLIPAKETYRMALFEQQLDASRPHTLLTTDTKYSGSLQYRFDDTDEVVTVPNIWYNQTYQTRAAAVRFEAQRADEMAAKYDRCPPLGMTPNASKDVARRYRERAALIRAEADRMIAAGEADFPVRAALLTLDYGNNVL